MTACISFKAWVQLYSVRVLGNLQSYQALVRLVNLRDLRQLL